MVTTKSTDPGKSVMQQPVTGFDFVEGLCTNKDIDLKLSKYNIILI